MNTKQIIIRNEEFLFSKNPIGKYKNETNISGYVFQYNNAPLLFKTASKHSIIIYGVVVDSRNPHNSENVIIDYLLESADFKDLIERSKFLSGRFVIVYSSQTELNILTDAIASIQVAYTVEGDLYISSNAKTIADYCGFKESEKATKIKASADESHPLPYDLSMYNEIKHVIPNHYLDCIKRETVRYYPCQKEDKLSLEEAAQKTSLMIRQIIRGYSEYNKLALPLTSGVDSRLILSMCKELPDIPTFIFVHEYFKSDTGDLVIPRLLSKKFNFHHYEFNDLELPNELIKIYKAEIGNTFIHGEARNAWTYYNTPLRGYTRLDGNISPLAKSSFGRKLPESLATASFLVTKTHNFSKENFREVKRWRKNVVEKSKLSGISKFDLFFWEHRAGKWTTNSYMNFDLLAKSLNPFNCRAVIETWLRVPRKDLVGSKLHREIIRLNWPELLDFPFNPDKKMDFVLRCSVLYYPACFMKFLFGKMNYSVHLLREKME